MGFASIDELAVEGRLYTAAQKAVLTLPSGYAWVAVSTGAGGGSMAGLGEIMWKIVRAATLPVRQQATKSAAGGGAPPTIMPVIPPNIIRQKVTYSTGGGSTPTLPPVVAVPPSGRQSQTPKTTATTPEPKSFLSNPLVLIGGLAVVAMFFLKSRKKSRR